MKVVLDTNVLMSGVFFGGVPGQVLEAWSTGRITLVVSPEIVDEYRRVGDELEEQYGEMGFPEILALAVREAEIRDATDVEAPHLPDPDDQKFVACALAGGASVIVSGDADLVGLDSWQGVEILSPREFVDEFLTGPDT